MTFRLIALLWLVSLLAWSGAATGREFAAPTDPLAGLQAQIDAQAAEIKSLQAELERQGNLWEPALVQGDSCSTDIMRRLPVVVEEPIESCDFDEDEKLFKEQRYLVEFDDGLAILPVQPERDPFSLTINGRIQFRHHAFARGAETWTDNAGVTRAIRNRNAFDVERARLSIEGFVLDERLTYFLNLDGDTDDGHAVTFFDYWGAWQATDWLQFQVGKRKAAAVRQWLLSSGRTRLVDRPVANDFFRPDRVLGVFAIGDLGEFGRFECMVSNGYDAADLTNEETDNRFTFAATGYLDPWGEYGEEIVDFDVVADPVVRLGHSFVFSPQGGDNGAPFPETGFARLTDGTQLTQIGALAPGVTVSAFDAYLYAVDAAWKWRGWSLNAEAFLRWLEEIEGDAPLPLTSLFQHGFYVEGGVFLIPQTFDFNARYSQVNGRFGDFSEYAAGCNWYPLAKTQFKVSFDVTYLNGSPLDNSSSDVVVGDEGVLFRTQLQAQF